MQEIKEEAICEERTAQGTLRDLYLVLFRHKWKMALFFLVVTVTVTAATFLTAEIYRSEAKLLVRVGRESVTLDPTATTGQTIQISQSRQSEINSELEILKSRELAEKVVDFIGFKAFIERPDEQLYAESPMQEKVRKTRKDIRIVAGGPRRLLERLDLADPIDERTKAILTVMKKLKVEASKDSSIISISYEAQSPKLAQNAVAKIMDFYLKKHIDVHQTTGSHEFFLQQSIQLRSKLEKLEDELRNLKDETGISTLEEQRLIIVDRIGSLEQEIEQNEAGLAASKAKVETLRKTLQPTLPVEEAIVSSLQAKVDAQKIQLAETLEELKALNESEIKIKRLEREIRIEEANYKKYSESLEQARIDHALEAGNISNISIVQPATVPIKPVRPRKLLNLILGIILGILGAIGLAFICEYLDHSIKTPEEAEDKLQLPTLASIPRVRTNGFFPSTNSGNRQASNKMSIRWKSRVLAAKLKRITAGKRFSEVWNIPVQVREQYAVFAEQLLMSSNGSSKKPRVIAILSCHSHEGVSTVATNLSASLARQITGDVLLVNLSNNSLSLYRKFRNGQSNGDAILSIPEQKHPLLVADNNNQNRPNIIDSDRFKEKLNLMKQPYDFVVMDLPAMSQASYVPRISSLCDNVIMVVEAERLRWEVIQRAKEQLVKSQAKILGVVLNKRQFHIPAWLYKTL